MSSIIVRGLDDAVKQQLAAQTKEHGRSIEAEVRDILTKAARRPHIGMALLSVARNAGDVAERYAEVLAARDAAGMPIGTADAQIAEICLAHEAVCATRNANDFQYSGVKIVDPWSVEA